MAVRLTIRIDFEPGRALGPGKVRLLEQIEITGSIRRSASAMKMSYRRAWLLLKATEEIFDAPLVLASAGGKQGGGASLTALAKEIVRRYRTIERSAQRIAGKQVASLVHSRIAGRKKSRKTGKKADH